MTFHPGLSHFITINCRMRDGASLLQGNVPDRLLESAHCYEGMGCWFIWLMLVMPDHLHMIATFDLLGGIKKTVNSWKRYQTTHLKLDWQSGFFEHRLRNESDFVEKAHCIRMNPVRKDLVRKPEEWRWVLDRTCWAGQTPR